MIFFKLTMIIAVLLASTTIIAYAPSPFIWLSLLWGALLCFLSATQKHTSLRALWINFAVVVIAIGTVELYFEFREPVRMTGNYMDGYFVEHDLLGYSPAKARESRASKFHGKDLIYDVNYNIDNRGLRISPQVQDHITCGSVLFFGGSVTFGEGVEDDETLPYVTGVFTDGRFAIDNFGFHGYGPHQMLAALEHGIVDQTITEPVSYVIYQGMPPHVIRSAGKASWDRHGPRYIMNANGQPVYSGPFDADLPHPLRWLRKQLDKSALYRWSSNLQQDPTPDEIELYIAIVSKARDIVVSMYPTAEFHVLMWGDDGEKTYEAILDGFHRNKLNVHTIDTILPSYAQNPQSYKLSPFDAHPNPRAYNKIARYISKRIIRSSSCQKSGLLAAGG